MSNLPYYLFTGESTSSVSAFKRNQSKFQSQHEQFKNAIRASREMAENDRRRKEKCGKIQAVWRSYHVRKNLKNFLRQEFDRSLEECSHLSDITDQIRRLNYFWIAEEDNDIRRIVRLVTLILSKNYLQSEEILKSKEFTIAGFLISCIKYVILAASDNKLPLTCLRCFEIYLKSDYVSNLNFRRLINGGYFGMLSHIIKHRIPDLINDAIIEKSPVFLGESILDLYKLSLNVPSRLDDKDLKSQCFRKLLNNFAENWSPFYKCYLLSQLCRYFTLDDFVSFSNDVDNIEFSVDGKISTFYVYIWLFIIDKCQIKSINTIRRIPYILRTLLIKYVAFLKSITSVEEDDDEMEFEEDDEPPVGGHSWKVSPCIAPHVIQIRIVGYTFYTLVSPHTSSRTRRLILDLCDGENFRRYFLANLDVNDDSNIIGTLALIYYAINFLQKLGSDRTIKNRLFLETLHRGLSVRESDRKRCLPLLYVFCDLLRCRLCAADDFEIRMSSSAESVFPFKLDELKEISGSLRDVATGLVELALPDAKCPVPERYRAALQSMGADLTPDSPREWNELFLAVVQLLQLLQQLDERLEFCPPKYWAVRNCFALANRQFFRYSNRRRGYNMPFHAARYFSRQEFEEGNKQLLSSSDLQALTILRKLPFLIPFEDRIVFLYQLTMSEKEDNGRQHWTPGVPISVSRDRIYEDSFSALSVESVPNLKQVLRVSMKNWAGASEAGVDGGGIFREFISELLKAGFSPTRGLFASTHDNQLYPNPLSRLIYPDNYRRQFFFLGRILGKLIFENQLAELPLAKFFLDRLLAHDVDSIDTEIKEQVESFCEGLASMIDLDWLRMFSPNELQMIISGDERTFDVDDLKNNTTIAITTDEADSDQVVGMFWKVIRSFNNDLRRKLLKFVSGCSRPPLLGFKQWILVLLE
uniref:HECT-type E3 ubiquitin transferase n=1 Tax=Romanomermis culicivorax TaxID=13658 RepID=A0A915LCB2_ROMCU